MVSSPKVVNIGSGKSLGGKILISDLDVLSLQCLCVVHPGINKLSRSHSGFRDKYLFVFYVCVSSCRNHGQDCLEKICRL